MRVGSSLSLYREIIEHICAIKFTLLIPKFLFGMKAIKLLTIFHRVLRLVKGL